MPELRDVADAVRRRMAHIAMRASISVLMANMPERQSNLAGDQGRKV